MANDFLKVFNGGDCGQTKFVTATTKVSGKTGLDVTICNPEDIAGGAEPCIQNFTNQEILASTVETQVTFAQVEKTYIKITNISEFYPIFFSQTSGGTGDVLLPCSVTTFCMNTLVNDDLFFITESGDARVVISQGQS